MIHRFDYKIEMPKGQPRSAAWAALVAMVFCVAGGAMIGVDLMAHGAWWILPLPLALVVWTTRRLVVAAERCHRAYGRLEGTVDVVKELGLNDKAFLEVPRDAKVVDFVDLTPAADGEL